MPAANPAYLALLRRPVVSLSDATAAYGGKVRAAAQALFAMQKRGLLVKVRRGLYVPGPRQDPDWRANWDPYLVAGRLRPDATLAFHSALVVRGVAQTPAESRVHFVTSTVIRRFSFEGVDFAPYLLPRADVRRSAVDYPRSGEVLRVARPEWAIAMCCRLPSRGGGFEEISRSSAGFRRIDAAELLSACSALRTSGIYNRAGFLLWLHRRVWRIRPEELLPFKERMSGSPVPFGAGAGGSVLVREWKLLIPKSGREVLELGGD